MKKHKDRPFALLGVDFPAGHDTPEMLRNLEENGTINWRFWYDKRPHPIVRSYKVEAYPTLFLLDHRGVIRGVDLYDFEEIEERVEELIREAERANATS